MTHQLAEFKHERGTISVYSHGIVISGLKEDIFIGEDFIESIELYCAFLALSREELVTEFGGLISGNEDQPPVDQFLIRCVSPNLFLITNDQDDGASFTADRTFMELLKKATAFLINESGSGLKLNRTSWAIKGFFPDTDLTYAIDKTGMELYVTIDAEVYVLATSIMDRKLWIRAIEIGREMLYDEVPDGSWQILKPKKPQDKGMRLELDGEMVLYTLSDPTLPGMNVSLYLNGRSMTLLECVLDTVWPGQNRREDGNEIRIIDLLDDDDDEEGSVS